MSDFLNFNIIDQVPDGDPKFNITNNPDGTKNIELANELIEIGTPLNKATFDKLKKINNILGYNTATGQWNPLTSTAEFLVDNDISDLLNNEILLVTPSNKVSSPPDDWSKITEVINMGTGFNEPLLIEFNNGNIFLTGNNPSDSYRTYFNIFNNKGQIIKSRTEIGVMMHTKIIKLSNGNVFLAGQDNNNGYLRYCIIDQNGNFVKTLTSGSRIMMYPSLIQMSDGNIIIAGANHNTTNRTGYFSIIKPTGETIVDGTQLGNGIALSNMIELHNGNIMIIGSLIKNGNGYTISIVSPNGNIIQSPLMIGSNDLEHTNLLEMSNGNILAVGTGYNSTGYFSIIGQNGEVIKNATAINGSLDSLEVDYANDNYIISGRSNSNFYIAIIDNLGNYVLNPTNIGTSYYTYFDLLKLSIGNLFVASVNHGLILDENGVIIKDTTYIGDFYNYVRAIELSNGNIVIAGCNGSTGYINIIEPFSANAQATINGIPLDTLIQKNKYYELIYNESQNKFIAEEVRNAN